MVDLGFRDSILGFRDGTRITAHFPRQTPFFVEAEHSCSNASVSQGAEYPACRSQTLWREAIRLHFHDNLPATLITRCTAKLWAPASAVRKPITRGQRLEDRLHTFETAQPLAGS